MVRRAEWDIQTVARPAVSGPTREEAEAENDDSAKAVPRTVTDLAPVVGMLLPMAVDTTGDEKVKTAVADCAAAWVVAENPMAFGAEAAKATDLIATEVWETHAVA